MPTGADAAKDEPAGHTARGLGTNGAPPVVKRGARDEQDLLLSSLPLRSWRRTGKIQRKGKFYENKAKEGGRRWKQEEAESARMTNKIIN